MKYNIESILQRATAASLAAVMTLGLASCSPKPSTIENLVENDTAKKKIVNLFGPMEKSKPNATNTARTAFDQTIGLAEKELALTVEYRTYTAENYQEKTYDDVVLDRVRSNMDDFYLPLEQRQQNWKEIPGGNMDLQKCTPTNFQSIPVLSFPTVLFPMHLIPTSFPLSIHSTHSSLLPITSNVYFIFQHGLCKR